MQFWPRCSPRRERTCHEQDDDQDRRRHACRCNPPLRGLARGCLPRPHRAQPDPEVASRPGRLDDAGLHQRAATGRKNPLRVERRQGGGFYLTGEYLELVPFSRIVHVERMHVPDPTPDNHVETRFEPDGTGTLMTMRMTLPDAAARAAMLATGMEHGMEASYVRLETMI